ncbi:MAG TPA: FAD-dependent oxidoreductase [Nocardioidaceae bacterium]|nr:FAD-dependent oxidoreductase [Nocardioidaceae bacterium]
MRVVVVGNGMAAARLVEELVARRGQGAADPEITVVGDERGPSYNRILLSAVLEGTHPASRIALQDTGFLEERGVALLAGTRVAEVDRQRREVVLEGGRRLPYDRLVLATGSIPTLPPIRGIVTPDGRLHPKVHAFRSLDDCRRLDAAITPGQRAVVVGGGLLGLQVARALQVRGLEVDLVEGTSHLLSSQVGEQAGAVIARSMRRLGTEVYTHTRAVRLTAEGLRLDSGYTLPADHVVLTAGGRPATAIAKGAGLFVRRGVVVDGRLRSVTDDRVHAIGDCAEHAGRTPGFVAPAWEQAGILAEVLTGGRAEYDGSRVVARLRATGLDVAVLGDPEHTVGEVVEVANPITGTYRKLVVRGGVIEAAVMVGDLARVGLVTQLFDRRTVLGPEEPGLLLMADAPVTTAPLPDDAEVCACAGVTAGRLRRCADLPAAVADTRATTGCGGCAQTVKELVGTAIGL